MEKKIYVADGDLYTQSGDFLRAATDAEIASADEQGYIECPDDVVDLVTIGDDGVTRAH